MSACEAVFVILCCLLSFSSCVADAIVESASFANGSFSVISVAPSQFYSFAPAVITVVGHGLPPQCVVRLALSSDAAPDPHAPGAFEYPCSFSSQFLVTFTLPALSLQLLKERCDAADPALPRCAVDVAVLSQRPSSASASHARVLRALVIQPPPTFGDFPLGVQLLPAHPVLLSGLSSPPLPCSTLSPAPLSLLPLPLRHRSEFHIQPILQTVLQLAALQMAVRCPQRFVRAAHPRRRLCWPAASALVPPHGAVDGR